MNHPDKDRIIEVLLKVGGRAARESTSEHPEDIADTISMAVESAGVTLREAHILGLIP